MTPNQTNASVSSVQPRPLEILTMPLRGRHLIEASAGTGKTYNITRLFIRLLLEKHINVQQALIVTYTKAATEELKNRISGEVNRLIRVLTDEPTELDHDYRQMIVNGFSENNSLASENSLENTDFLTYVPAALLRLKAASLDLDDASIFTINGFCHRVLGQSSFMRNRAFQTELVESSEQFYLEEIRDWFRREIHLDETKRLLASFGIAVPEDMYHCFRDAFYTTDTLIALDESVLEQQIQLAESNYKNALQNTINIIDSANARRNQIFTHVHQILKAIEGDIKSLFATAKKDYSPELNSLLEWLDSKLCTSMPASSKINGLFGKTLVKQYANFAISKGDSGLLTHAASESEYNDLLLGFLPAYKELAAELKGPIKTLKDAEKEVNSIKNDDSKRQYIKDSQTILQVITRIKQAVQEQKLRRDVIDHTDTIQELAHSIGSGNQHIVDYIRDQYPYALIDEFQDTDSAQYSIFSTCYPQSDEKYILMMIGDPKQAIYRFRGGDIYTYLDARKNADYCWSMQHNYRSDSTVINAYNALFYGAPTKSMTVDEIIQRLPREQQDLRANESKLESYQAGASNRTQENEPNAIFAEATFGQDISYPWIYSGKPNNHSGLTFTDLTDEDSAHLSSSAAIEFQVNTDICELTDGKADAYKGEQARRVANEIIRLTKHGRIADKRVAYKDIAILVQAKGEAEKIQEALSAANIASVYLSEKRNVFESGQANQLFIALDGILNYENNRKFVRALSSELLGFSPSELFTMQNDISAFDEQKSHFYELKSLWKSEGIYVLINHLVKHHFTPKTDLETRERIITNYLHLAELLNTQSKNTDHAYQLLNWLQKQLATNDADSDISNKQESEQRLESDEALVKVVTLHGSKGLEYPVVFIPFAGFKPKDMRPSHSLKFYKPDDSQTYLQIGLLEDTAEEHLQNQQEFEELVRLLYVGITRAIHKCYLGIGKKSHFDKSALAHLLRFQAIDNLSDDLQALCQKNPNLFGLCTFQSDEAIEVAEDATEIKELQYSRFTQSTDQQWALESFSKVSRQIHHIDLLEKDRFEGNDASLRSHTQYSLPTPEDEYRFNIERSAETGNLLHNLLEDHNFSDVFSINETNPHVMFFNTSKRSCQVEQLNQWLNDVLQTPLVHSLAPSSVSEHQSFCLKDLSPTSTLKEPEFYFPLTNISASTLTALLRDHRNELARTGLALNENGNTSQTDFITTNIGKLDTTAIYGMMHGFIDLLFEHEGRFYVADYKSNYLGNSPDDYTRDKLQLAIQEHLYDLQYLIYSWALDKYLSKRIENYSREQHFGGVFYLFLRGMSPSFSPGSGVYYQPLSKQSWRLLDTVFGDTKTVKSLSENDEADTI